MWRILVPCLGLLLLGACSDSRDKYGGDSDIATTTIVACSGSTYTVGQPVDYDRPNASDGSGNFHLELFGHIPNEVSEQIWAERSPLRAPASYGNPLFKRALKGDVDFAPSGTQVNITIVGIDGNSMQGLALLKTDRSNTDRFVKCLTPSTVTATTATFEGVDIGGSVHSLVVPYGRLLLTQEVSVLIEAVGFNMIDPTGRVADKLAIADNAMVMSLMFRLVPDKKGSGKQTCDGDGKVCVGAIVPIQVFSN